MNAIRNWLLLFFLASSSSFANEVVLDENCIINILNRTVNADQDGSFNIPNVPSTMGQVRARATCIKEGKRGCSIFCVTT